MLLWYTGMSVLLVFNVFRSAGIDFRLVATGSLLPLLVDVPFGHPAIGHTLLAGGALLAAVMLATIRRPRLLRRRWLCLPIGMLGGLLLSGAWTSTAVFWWPTQGIGFPGGSLVPVWWALALEELAGLVAWWWAVGLFDLYERGPRREFLRTGRLRVTDRGL
jgi:hypothetical protein